MALKNVKFTLSELNKLVSNKKSCVELKENSARKLILMPIQLTDLKLSIKECLDAQVTTYDEELDGIILSFKNVKVFTLAHDDPGNPTIPVNYIADVYIFKPKLKRTLTGVVTKKSNNQVGCIVYKIFNVTIPCPTKTPIEDWEGGSLNIGDEVNFRIDSVDLSGHLPFIKGYL